MRAEAGGIRSWELFRTGGGTESLFCRPRELWVDFRQGCDTFRVLVLERPLEMRRLGNCEKSSPFKRRDYGQKPVFREAGALSHPGTRPDYSNINLKGFGQGWSRRRSNREIEEGTALPSWLSEGGFTECLGAEGEGMVVREG